MMIFKSTEENKFEGTGLVCAVPAPVWDCSSSTVRGVMTAPNHRKPSAEPALLPPPRSHKQETQTQSQHHKNSKFTFPGLIKAPLVGHIELSRSRAVGSE